jgi:hypothetical protein
LWRDSTSDHYGFGAFHPRCPNRLDLEPKCFDAVSKVEKVAAKCLKKGDWLLDHLEEELAFIQARIFVSSVRCAAQPR